MCDKSISGNWDPNIPIEFDKDNLETVKIETEQRLSLDGSQKVKYNYKDDQYIFQIFGSQDSKLIQEFQVEVLDFHYKIQEIFFTAEYFILIRNKPSRQFEYVDVYIYSFIFNKGEHFIFKRAQFLTYFHSKQEFYLLIKLQEYNILRLCKVDQQFQIQQLNEIDIKDLQLLKQNNFGFFLHAEGKLSFLSKSLKLCCLFVYMNKRRFYYEDYFEVDFDKNLYYSNFLNGKCTVVAQIRNSRLIRKLDYDRFAQYDKIFRCIYKNYLISCLNGYCLIVHNLITGEELAKVKFKGYNKFFYMAILNGYLFFRDWYNNAFGWKLKND